MAAGKAEAKAPVKGAKAKAPQPGSAPSRTAIETREDGVLVRDAALASRLHQKGWVGAAQDDGSLALSVVEAAWLCAQGRLQVPGGAAALLASGAASGSRTEVVFLAYSDLRSRGLLVRHSERGLWVWPRGGTPLQEPEYEVEVLAEADPVRGEGLLEGARSGRVLGLVDEDGEVTYYRIVLAKPTGKRPSPSRATAAPVRGTLLADRVLVDPEASGGLAEEGIGVRSEAGVVVSLLEAFALSRRKALVVPGLAARTPPVALAAYEALRAAGVVVKSGFRFGTHLRGYEGDPGEGHARWLVQVLEPGTHWSSLSRGIRLSHGVRKEFLVAVGEAPLFVAMAWFKP